MRPETLSHSVILKLMVKMDDVGPTDRQCVCVGGEGALISVVGPEPAHRSSGHKESHDGRQSALTPLLVSSQLRGLHSTSAL